MAVKDSPLRVVLNKWADVDANGDPKGVCIRDPKVTGGTREHIGMKVDLEKSVLPTPGDGNRKAEFGKTFGPGTLRPQGPKETVAFVYSDEIVPIENTQFHREMVRRGNLFAADLETFKIVFSTPGGFLEPAVLMTNAEKHARLRRGLSVSKENTSETSDTGAPAPAPPRQEDTVDGTNPETTSEVPVPRKNPTKTPPIVPRNQG